PDVEAGYPGWTLHGRAQHRFVIPLSLSEGPHAVCAYGINVGPATNALLGSIPVAVQVDPFGSLDIAIANTFRNRVILHGWALDPNAGDQIDVHLYADGHPVGVMTANRY